jgi:hypothetical protein
MLITLHRQHGHAYWAIWPISLQLCGAIVLLNIKVNGERKGAMIARFDHRPKLTAALALATIVLVVVVTLATLLITLQPAASPESDSGTSNPGAAAAPANPDAGEGHDKLVDYPNTVHDT